MRKCTKRWTTATGDQIRICDMTDSHLINTIKMLRRLHMELIGDAYIAASSLQGEMASYYADQGCAQLEEMESEHPFYNDLTNDAARRGLKL